MNYFFSLLLLIASTATYANDTLQLNAEEMNNIGIEVTEIKSITESLTSKLPAKVTIPNKSQRVISVPQDGVIEIMLVAEGDVVKADQELAQLNSPQIVSGQNDYLQSLSRLSQSQQEMQRDKSLFDEGIIAERRYRQSLSTYEQDKADVAMYKKRLEMAGMNADAIRILDKTRSLNSRLILTAPDDGVVMKQFATAGQRLTAADPLYQLAELSTLWLEIHVPLDIANNVEINDRLTVCDKSVEGKVIAVGREVHAADQGVLVRAEINQKTEQLTPGEFIEVCFIQQAEKAQFEVPRSAVFRNEGMSAVFLKSDDGFIYKNVNIVKDNGNQLVISGDLSPQQMVVISGTATLKAAWLGIGGE
ncbi:MAG: efflux RND transporter periplasmic adaptor subunit [Pseudomonadota bacterium]|nr:efflux RND transporter periplasmic adaptor subunit [Pseudomonadota bacterium]